MSVAGAEGVGDAVVGCEGGGLVDAEACEGVGLVGWWFVGRVLLKKGGRKRRGGRTRRRSFWRRKKHGGAMMMDWIDYIPRAGIE